MPTPASVELHGHRGARGLAPENTLAGFAVTLNTGVDAIEFDLGMSADGQLVIYHDLWLNPKFTRDAAGRFLDAKGPALNTLTLEQLQRYDVGRLKPGTQYADKYPNQIPVDGARIPTFADMVELVDQLDCPHLRYNIEVKVEPDHASASASPLEFAEAVVREIDRLGIADRSVVQSFWWAVPTAVNSINPAIPTSCLTSEQPWGDNIQRHIPGPSPWTGRDIRDFGGSVAAMAHDAGASVWAPWYDELTAESIDEAQALDLRVITWTVNEKDSMHRLIRQGVDGIITDYPDRLREVLGEAGHALPPQAPGGIRDGA